MNQKILFGLGLILLCNCQKKEVPFDDPLLSHRDTLTSPATDFFQYVNGKWFADHPIPETERGNGIFRTIGDTINAQVRKICENAAKNQSAEQGSKEQKIGDFFASGMDSIKIDKLGIKPLEPYFRQIESLSDIKSVFEYMSTMHTKGAGAGYAFYVSQDDKISTKYAAFLSQGGLGMGNRDYYFNLDNETKAIREAYQKHVNKMFELTGSNKNDANLKSKVIYQIELELAGVSRKLEELRDPLSNYHKMAVKDLVKWSPKLPWKNMLKQHGLAQLDTVIVGQPEFFKGLDALSTKYKVEDWKSYLKWDFLNSYAAYLSTDIEQENFYFYSTIMNGVKKQKPRWKRVVEQTNGSLGELIGQVYVKDYLPKGTKEKLVEIGNNIREVYALHLQKLDWMGAETKKKALDKLQKIVMKVGYPDHWKDLSNLKISRNSYCENVMAANAWEYQYMVNKFGKPVDRTEWNMYPQTYNAYYNPSNNEIVVPACNILVPGFENRMPDDAVLYGIIGGSTFGHEITHGFDDQGSQYDANGNLKNWWTAGDLKRFKQKTKMIVEQFSAYEALPKKFVNGDATQGENIADLGGVVMGYEAFKKTKQFTTNQNISGLTPAQRYFMAYGYAWMVNYKKEMLQQQLMTDVHAPAKYRVNGPISNMPEFYEAFGVKEGSPMRRAKNKQVIIW